MMKPSNLRSELSQDVEDLLIRASLVLLVLLLPGLAYAQTPTLVQHVLCPNSANETPVPASSQAYRCPLLRPTRANNTILVAVTAGGNFTFTVTDDQADSFELLKSSFDSTNDQIVAVHCASGITAGSAMINVQPSSASQFMQVDEYEFQNASCTVDGSSTNAGTVGTSMQAGSLTTANGPDLIFQVAVNDGSGTFSSVTAGASPWVLQAVDRVGGFAAQYQVQAIAGAINPTLTQATSSRYISAAVALRSSSNGSPHPAFSILSLEHLNTGDVSSATLTYQCPLHGNLLVLDWTSDGANTLNSVTDGTNAITQIGSNVMFPENGGVLHPGSTPRESPRIITRL